MPRRRHIEVLLRKAAQDEGALRALLAHQDVAVEVLGFHAQQAAEKLLKAAIRARGAEYPLTHRLTDLLDQLASLGVDVPDDLAAVKELTPFAVEFRYDILPPAEQEGLDREQCYQLILRLRAWVESVVSPMG
jgi:HEPN domain-containing protein